DRLRATPRGEFRMCRNIRGAPYLVLVPCHQHTILRGDQIRFDEVGALHHGKRIRRQGVLGQIAARAAMCNQDGLSAGVHQRIVTSSSATVGWMASVSSKSLFVAPIRTATAKPCSISSTLRPARCTPTMRSSLPTVTSFIRVRGLLPVNALYIGTKAVV